MSTIAERFPSTTIGIPVTEAAVREGMFIHMQVNLPASEGTLQNGIIMAERQVFPFSGRPFVVTRYARNENGDVFFFSSHYDMDYARAWEVFQTASISEVGHFLREGVAS